jgi:hypothetical protein
MENTAYDPALDGFVEPAVQAELDRLARVAYEANEARKHLIRTCPSLDAAREEIAALEATYRAADAAYDAAWAKAAE